MSHADTVIAFVVAHPDRTEKEISRALHIPEMAVTRILRFHASTGRVHWLAGGPRGGKVWRAGRGQSQDSLLGLGAVVGRAGTAGGS